MSKLYVYVMTARNKDNKTIEGFKTREKAIVEYEENESKVMEAFDSFVNKGVPGEMVRLYRTVNTRNEEKVMNELICRLVSDKPSVTKLNRVLASVAQQACNRDEKKWLFDFDIDDEKLVNEFVSDILKSAPKLNSDDIEIHKTPNGYAIVVLHGFDPRALDEKWKGYEIENKRDALLFMKAETKK